MDQQSPPPHQAPPHYLVPPKPSAEYPFAAPLQEPQFQQPYQQPYQAQQPFQQQPYQQGDVPPQFNNSGVYPTPAPEQAYPPYLYPYPTQQGGQSSYTAQQQYQQQAPSQQYSQQQAPGQPMHQIPVQPVQPGAQSPQYPYPLPQGGQAPHNAQQQYQPQGNQNPYLQQPQQWHQDGSQRPLTNSFASYLTLGILAVLFCGGIFAIPSLVYTTMMNTAYKQGNGALYLMHKKTSLVWLIVAFCLGLVANIFLFVSALGDSSLSLYY